jgi:hypothetical protein
MSICGNHDDRDCTTVAFWEHFDDKTGKTVPFGEIVWTIRINNGHLRKL